MISNTKLHKCCVFKTRTKRLRKRRGLCEVIFPPDAFLKTWAFSPTPPLLCTHLCSCPPLPPPHSAPASLLDHGLPSSLSCLLTPTYLQAGPKASQSCRSGWGGPRGLPAAGLPAPHCAVGVCVSLPGLGVSGGGETPCCSHGVHSAQPSLTTLDIRVMDG